MMDVLTLRKLTRAVRRVPGTLPLLELLRRRYMKQQRSFVVNDYDGNLHIDLDTAEHMSSQTFWYGSYSASILMVLKPLLRPGMTFVDVGANIGEITLFAAKRVGANGRVFAFEPVKQFADRLRKNIALNSFTQVEVIQLALSDRVQARPMYGPVDAFSDGSTNSGLATLYANEDRRAVIDTVQLTTLDTYFAKRGVERIDVIKIDIEGAELPALRGAQQVLRKYRPWLIVEVQDEMSRAGGYEQSDILRFLETHNYEFKKIGKRGKVYTVTARTLNRFQNILCVPRP